MQLLALFAFSVAFQVKAVNPVLAPLHVYAGIWLVSRSGVSAGTKPDQLVNTCAALGQYFACQQTVNEKVSALVVFMPSGKPGRFYIQNIMPEGWASGRSDLEIAGDHWTYTNTRTDAGRTTYYRTTNVFSGNNRIHFEQAQSSDNAHWNVTGSGDEVRAGAR